MECNSISQINDQRVVVIWSGGLDSSALIPLLLKEYNCEVFPLFIKRGQENYDEEKRAVNYYNSKFNSDYPLKYTDVVEIEIPIPPKKFREIMSETNYHKLRNSDIINQAVRYALHVEAKIVAIGSLPTDKKWNDGSQEYLQSKTNEVRIATGDMGFCVISPYLLLGYDKEDIVTWGSKNNIDFQKTRSCFKKTKRQCGNCDACKNRKEAFRLAAVEDTTEYD